MAVFLVMIAAIGWFVGYYYQSPDILIFALVFALAMNVTSYWYSDKISLSLAGAKPAEKENNLELFRIVENLSITAGLPMPKIYIIDDSAPNAFATGRDKDHAAVAVTSGLLNMMDKNELSGVIAHELSHIGNRDTLLMTVVVVLVGLIAILGNVFSRSMLFSGRRRSSDREGEAGALIMVIGVIFVVISPLIAKLIQLAVSRKREFLADADGALLTRYPEGLASALEKISAYALPMKRASNATAHLFISNPFGAGAAKGLSKLFMTHPPTEERIAALRGLDISGAPA
jgi:heat shock protein HtpX